MSSQPKLDLTPVKTRPVVIVSDTDLHGVSLGAALMRALALIAGEEQLAVISHFDTRGPATTARGDVPAMIRQLAQNVEQQHNIYIADVPPKMGAEADTIAALSELVNKAGRVVYIDHHVDVLKHFAQSGYRLPRLDYRVYADAFSTYLPALLTAIMNNDQEAARHIFDLAVLGMIADMDVNALPIAQQVASALNYEIPTLEEVRKNYHVVVAIDSVIKSPKKPSIDSDAEIIGNMAPVIPWLAKKPLAELAQEALSIAPTPRPEEVAADAEVVKGVVVVYKKLAPMGQGAKYASLLEAALDVPIVVTAAPVPRVQEYVVVGAYANAFLGSDVVAEVGKFLSEVKETIVNELLEKQLTKKEWLRPSPSFSIPVDAAKWEEAAEYVAERLASLWAERHREKLAAEVAKEELTVLVADEKLAASVARIVESAVEAAVRRIEQLLKERR